MASNRHVGETPKSRVRERKLLGAMSRYFEREFDQAPPASGKYRIDGWLFDRNKNVFAWLECKWTKDGKTAYGMLNIPKFIELCNLAYSCNCSSYYVVRENDRWGYLEVHNGVVARNDARFLIAGAPPDFRPPNDDDIEPMVEFPKKKIVWVYEDLT